LENVLNPLQGGLIKGIEGGGRKLKEKKE